MKDEIHNLVKHSENCFKEEENNGEKDPKYFYRYLINFETEFDILVKLTQNLSDIELNQFEYPLHYSRSIELGNEIEIKQNKSFSDFERIKTAFRGKFEIHNSSIGFISSSGLSESFSKMTVYIVCSNQMGESGIIHLIDRHSLEPGFHLTAQLSNERFHWLDKEISSRPSARVKISVFLRAFQERISYNAYSRYDERQFYYLEDKPENILGVSFSITN